MFLPGALGDTSLWRPLSERIRAGGARRFFGWPGFSGVPADPAVRGIADLAARVATELTGPSALFAQSMGGVVAILAALARPEHVRCLVLAVTSGGVDLTGSGAFDWRPELRRQHPQLPRWFEDERWDLSDRLREIRVPVLLLWGDADPISPVAVGKRLAGLLPDAELVVIAGGTHDLVRERVDEIAPHVDRYLAKVDVEGSNPFSR